MREATALLGSEIRQARGERKWTIRQLAERAGISPTTLSRVERGDPTVSIGVAFDLAVLTGVPLFYPESSRLSGELARSRERAVLLGQRVRPVGEDLDDDF